MNYPQLSNVQRLSGAFVADSPEGTFIFAYDQQNQPVQVGVMLKDYNAVKSGHDEALARLKEYYDRLVILGDIKPAPTPEELAQRQLAALERLEKFESALPALEAIADAFPRINAMLKEWDELNRPTSAAPAASIPDMVA